MSNPFATYLSQVEVILRGGKGTEHTYRPALKTLIESLEPGVAASNEPKHIKCGAPDFIVEHGKVPLGFVETKDLGENLDGVEKSEQLKRYRSALRNLILTDYLEFRWYVNGQHRLEARIADVRKGGKLVSNEEGIVQAEQIFKEFFEAEVPTVGTPQELAERMAQLAKLVRDLIFQALQAEEDSENGVLHRQFNTFKEHLLPNLKPEEFSDIYAQTMAYGLFAAKISAPLNAKFGRSTAYKFLSANRFLNKLFLEADQELEGTLIAPFLDDLAALLARADMAAILKDFGKRTRTEDPVVHFYETFLAAYDPKMRESRGVYYTPEPVVQFIVNSVDGLLKNQFNRPSGLADPDVHLLDPATGTSTFLYFVVRRIYESLMARRQKGVWQEYVHTKLLPRVFGFELLMAPYVIAHLKLGLLLRELGYQWGKDDRLKIYLTNTLDEGIIPEASLRTLGYYLSEEASQAAKVKMETPIMVVMGNPPYSGISANNGEWISNLIEDYKKVDGKSLGERKHWLNDDYVKFIRFGQWRIEKTGQGILALITNHGYLDNPTFRGMRRSLMNTFDEIFILNLHGNSLKKETDLDGGKDENVFDIQQGVAIGIFVKKAGGKGNAIVHHADLRGDREGKYKYLATHDVPSTKWVKVQPNAPHYFFIPRDEFLRGEYEKSWSLQDVFSANSTGIVTARDDFVIDFETKALQARIKHFLNPSYSDAQVKSELGLAENYVWRVGNAREALRSSLPSKPPIKEILYRPLDTRNIYFHPAVVWRTREAIMSHMLAGENLALITTRQTREDWGATVTNLIAGHKTCSAYDINFIFPLYLYTTADDTKGTLFVQSETTRRPNLKPEFIRAFSAKLGLAFITDDGYSQRGGGDLKKTFGPEDVFRYAYAVFHSPTYRERYAEFLKIDFPRLPLTSDKKLFAKLVAKGAELVGLHLLKSPLLENLITSYSVSGDNAVEKVKYEKKKVWINEKQYFGGLPEEVWEFHIGGYQVCDKWLKDRKGRALSHDDIEHYQRVVVALKETMRLMVEIDKAIPAWPIT